MTIRGMNRAAALLALMALNGAWTYCGTWPDDQAINICLPEVEGSCDGVWSDEFEYAAGTWNELIASPQFLKYTTPAYSFSPDNGRSEASFSDQATVEELYGPVGSTAIGQTWWWWDGDCGAIAEADIFVYVDFAWTLDREATASGGPYSFDEVASHELGHFATLEHEDALLTMMNASTHVAPSLLDYPHVDEIGAMVAHTAFDAVVREDHVILPYADNNLATQLPSVTPTVVEPGDVLSLDDIRTENWGTLGTDDVTVTWVLSSNDIGSDQDLVFGSTFWIGIGYGYLDAPIELVTPVVLEGTYYVIGIVDFAGSVPDYYTFQDQLVVGSVFVECYDQDDDGAKALECGGTDCDDLDSRRAPGLAELCDGIDQDCDEVVDEGVQALWYTDADDDGFGADGSGELGCGDGAYASVDGDCDDADPSVYPGREDPCGGGDEDCDGLSDEDCETTDEPTRPGETEESDTGASAPKRKPVCGCSSSGPSGALWAGIPALLLALRRRVGRIGLAALAVFLVIAAPPARAVSVPLTEADLSAVAETVISGTVTRVEVDVWGPYAVPVTRVSVQVDEVWKGSRATEVTVWQPGGELPGRAAWVSGGVRYRPGMPVVLFLERSRSGVFVTVGMDVGAFTLVDGVLQPIVAESHPSESPGPSLRPFVGWTERQAASFVGIHGSDPRPHWLPQPAPPSGRDPAVAPAPIPVPTAGPTER